MTIKTKMPYAPLISSLTEPVASIVSPNAKDLGTTPDGTGPFKFVEFVKDVSLTVTRNDEYWNGTPKLDGGIIYYVTDPNTRAIQLESGDVDINTDLSQTYVADLKNNSDYIVYSKMTMSTYMLYINGNKAPYNDVRVRQALSYAINRDEICDNALEGIGGMPGVSIFPSILSWSINDKLSQPSYDPQKAKELLSEAGFKDTNGDGWLEYNGQPFTLTIKTYTFRPQLQPSAEVLVTQFQSIGINANLQIETTSLIESDLTGHNYDVVLYCWGVARTGDPDYIMSKLFLTNSSEALRTGYSNPTVDSLIQQGKVTTDPTQREQIYDEAQEQLLNDLPTINLFYQNSLAGTSKNVGNYAIYPTGYRLLTEDLYLKQ